MTPRRPRVVSDLKNRPRFAVLQKKQDGVRGTLGRATDGRRHRRVSRAAGQILRRTFVIEEDPGIFACAGEGGRWVYAEIVKGAQPRSFLKWCFG